jgi:hypothetical protein
MFYRGGILENGLRQLYGGYCLLLYINRVRLNLKIKKLLWVIAVLHCRYKIEFKNTNGIDRTRFYRKRKKVKPEMSFRQQILLRNHKFAVESGKYTESTTSSGVVDSNAESAKHKTQQMAVANTKTRSIQGVFTIQEEPYYHSGSDSCNTNDNCDDDIDDDSDSLI